jgi:hypothetical protein
LRSFRYASERHNILELVDDNAVNICERMLELGQGTWLTLRGGILRIATITRSISSQQ